MNRDDFTLAIDFLRAVPHAQRLASSKNSYVRKLIAQNPFVATSVIERLLFDPDDEVAGTALLNPRVSLNLALLVASERHLVHWLALTLPREKRSGRPKGRARRRPEVAFSPKNKATQTLAIPNFDVEELATREIAFLDHRPRLDAIAMHAVIHIERHYGHTPYPMAHNNKGFDIRSVTSDGERFIEVKGIGEKADTIVVSRSQIEFAAEKGGAFKLAVVVSDGQRTLDVYYLANPYPHDLLPTVAAVSFDAALLTAEGELVYRRASAPGIRSQAPQGVLF